MTKTIETGDEVLPLTQAIMQISGSLEALLKSGLNRRAIIVLLHDETGVNKREITKIIDSLPKLKDWFCAPAT
jgi:hypothetical protein